MSHNNQHDHGVGFWMTIAFIVVHIVQISILLTLLKNFNFVDPALYDAVVDQKSLDAMHVAAQLGRFDMASMVLAMIGIFISLAAIFAFLEVRSRSVRVAEESARAEAKIVAERVAKEAAEQSMKPVANRIVEEFFDNRGIDFNKLAVDYGIIPEDLNGIAAALESEAK